MSLAEAPPGLSLDVELWLRHASLVLASYAVNVHHASQLVLTTEAGFDLQTPRSKPQARQRVKDLRKLAAEAGLMVEDGSEEHIGGHDGEGGEGGDSMADEGSDPTGVIDVVTPLHVTAIPVCSPAS